MVPIERLVDATVNNVLKWLVRLFFGMVGAVVIGGAMGWYLMSRSLPSYDGTIALAGLSERVTIVRDANAVPHIRAATDRDAFYALGVAHAQDRLWQMEIGRRAAQGRLSEFFGARTIELDRLVKTLDLYELARRSEEHQSAETIAALEAYAEGVNAWIRHLHAQALGRGAPEFFVFGDGLAPWTPADSLAILKMMALRLSNAARQEVRYARAILTLPPERVMDILPDYPVAASTSPRRYSFDVPKDRKHAAAAPRDPLLDVLGPAHLPELGGASNSWAVDGTRTSSGKSLLASDPHLWLSAPSVWYLASMNSENLSVIGGTLPGVPAVLIGHNTEIGWGLTTAQVDDQDIYIEQVDPQDPGRYKLPDGSWVPFETRPIRILLDDDRVLTEVVRSTRRGPVLDNDEFGTRAITPDGHVVSLAWTALDPEDRSMTAALDLLRARTIEQAIEASENVLAPAQNLIIADEEGVGMAVAGALPLRSRNSLSQGRLPSSGAISANDWKGIRPAHRNPRYIRPGTGAVANANNRTTDASYPNHITFDWGYPYRIQRLNKELSGRAFHSREGFVALQSDTVSEVARAVLPLIARDLWWREGTPVVGDERRRLALEMLANWTGEMDQHGPEALIFAEWMRALTRRLASDELGPLFEEFAGPRPLFVERVFRNINGASIWCDVDKTREQETCSEIAALALDDALARLARDYGSNMEGWRWGAAHVAVHVHTPFGFGPLGIFFNIEHETSGGNYTLMRGHTSGTGSTPFRNVHAAGLRVVYDFADLDRSLMIISTGQSGHPFSRYYDHLAGLWARGDMIPMSMDEADARAGAVGILQLEPAP